MPQRLRICMFVANPIAYDGRVLRHARTLCEDGHQVTVLGVIGPMDQAPPIRDVPFATWRLDRRRQGVLPRLVWFTTAARQRLAQRLSDPLPAAVLERVPDLSALSIATSGVELCARAVLSNYDLFYANDLNTLPAARWAGRLRRRPFVYDAHEFYYDEVNDLSDSERRRRKVLEGQARDAAAMITVSELIADEMVALHGFARRPLPIRNLPPLIAVPPPDTRPLGAPGTLRVLYHGANVGLTQYGTDDVLRAVARVRGRMDIRYTIRGRLVPKEEADLKRRIHELGIDDLVTLCPPVSGAVALVQAAVAEGHDVGMAPHLALAKSWILTTGSKLYEYQHAGMAVVASDLVGNREAAGPAGVFYPPGDDAALAEIFWQLGQDRQRLRALQRLARQRAETELCWDRERERLIDLFRRLARGAP